MLSLYPFRVAFHAAPGSIRTALYSPYMEYGGMDTAYDAAPSLVHLLPWRQMHLYIDSIALLMHGYAACIE